MDQYYGMRRKRNIDLSRHRQPFAKDQQYEVEIEDDEEEIELEEGYEEIEEYEDEDINEVDLPHEDLGDPNYFMLDGKPFKLKQQSKKQSFSETHVRTTTYLDKNVHQIIRMLQQQNQIESITKFINDSIKHYLTTKYSK
ncbi:hypothetical protein [Peribacillus acanthi]|uniref:hypothetical protein n=1 Tax=Peribacillus acanthi TaxID=2171554 RepID=UPI000D3EB5E5|nr:hypothetical protein [Peribacillus acanthi]